MTRDDIQNIELARGHTIHAGIVLSRLGPFSDHRFQNALKNLEIAEEHLNELLAEVRAK